MIGKRIGGRYEVLKYIGGGGMSRVYLAHDVILDRDVAVKVLNYDFSNEEELKRRFMREALSATSLTHPHIVDIFDVGEDGDIHYLVMEYIEGQTLKEFIVSNGPLSPERALPIMQQLISAISNAHYNGIVHRDIKPQNILMDLEGNVKITDFGIAMALSATAHTKTNSVLGTVHYLSPEQARGGMATKKSDIYSVGIVFYELLTGKLPFSGESAVSIALKHLQEETPSVRALFPSIPQSVENVIIKATAKDAASRYGSADEMQDDLATVLSADRANEARFQVLFDDEATRAMPAIMDSSGFGHVEQTVKHEPVQKEEKSKPSKAKSAKSKAEPKPKKDKKRKKWPFILAGLIVAALLIFLFINLFGLKKVEVPDVSGMMEAEAIEDLKELGFKVKESIEELSDEVDAGKVIKTNPEANKVREVGTEITLYVSIGKEMVEIDDYIGHDYDRVASILDREGYKSTDSLGEFSDKPVGTILEQNPEAGSEIVPSETDVVFTISKGKDTFKLGDLHDLDEAGFVEYAKKNGIDIVVVKEEHSEKVAAGRVVSQTPSEGTEIERGGKVQVVLSKGPEEKPIKYIIKEVPIEYMLEESTVDEDGEPEEEEGADEEEEPERKPQTIRIYVQDRKNSLADPIDEFTITEDTVKKITIELEEGQRGAYRIMRDSTLIAEDTFDYSDN